MSTAKSLIRKVAAPVGVVITCLAFGLGVGWLVQPQPLHATQTCEQDECNRDCFLGSWCSYKCIDNTGHNTSCPVAGDGTCSTDACSP